MECNEFDLIDRYFKCLTRTADDVICGIGDDAAVLSIAAGNDLVVSTDTLVSGVHFFPDTDAGDIGFKSLAVNLSDMAAMAAVPRWATLSLTMETVDHEWLGKFAEGFAQLASKHAVSLIGGDLCHGPLSITVQIMGLAPEGTVLRRTGAKAGDYIYVTGNLGCAALALSRLGEGTGAVPEDCLQRFLRPVPRLEVGYGIREIATSAIDISDGLAADLGHILQASQTGAIIDLANVPLCEHLRQETDVQTTWNLALSSGDDYELCFTVPESALSQLKKIISSIDCKLSCIGQIAEGDGGVRWVSPDGSEYILQKTGYMHF